MMKQLESVPVSGKKADPWTKTIISDRFMKFATAAHYCCYDFRVYNVGEFTVENIEDKSSQEYLS